jgi:hypothetical protein
VPESVTQVAEPHERLGRSTWAEGDPPRPNDERMEAVSILWIILIVILVLALLGFFTRGRW